MKFMKLGSKLDSFQTDGKNVRYVANELATDILVNVGEVKFYLHKFPLLSKSACLQKLVATASENSDEINIHDIPGGPTAFEICAKFCYGMTVTLNAYNVVAARCAAEYLGMQESVEKGNLIYKIEVFLNSSILRTWKDSIIVLQTTNSLLPFSKELKIVSRCIDSIACKASVDTSKVDWSYSYNRKNLPEEIGNHRIYNGVVNRPMVPKDWWVEDLCELEIDSFKQVISAISTKGIVPNKVIGQALKAYVFRRLPGLTKTETDRTDLEKSQLTVDTIVWLLPSEKGTVSCGFLLKLLKAAVLVESEELTKRELIRRAGQQLEDASVSDLFIKPPEGETTLYDVDIVKNLVEAFQMQDENFDAEMQVELELQEMRSPGILSDASKLMVAKLIDGYLAEIAKDPHLTLSKFVGLAKVVSGFPRPAHDGLYRAIDTYLKEHPGLSKSESKTICRLMDCKKLSADASMHAVQNERLPLRVVVQVLYFEHVRATSSGSSTPELPKSIKDLNGSSNESSKSATTNTEEDWDAVATAEELKALKVEVASLRLRSERNGGDSTTNGVVDKAAAMSKIKGMIMSKRIFSRIWSSKGAQAENSGSDSSETLGSANQEEVKSTPSRNRRHSVS